MAKMDIVHHNVHFDISLVASCQTKLEQNSKSAKKCCEQSVEVFCNDCGASAPLGKQPALNFMQRAESFFPQYFLCYFMCSTAFF